MASQIVEPQTNGSPVEPAAGVFAVRLRGPPELPEGFDRQFLGAAGVADDARNRARDAGVIGVEARLEVEVRRPGVDLLHRVGLSVHNNSTPAAAG